MREGAVAERQREECEMCVGTVCTLDDKEIKYVGGVVGSVHDRKHFNLNQVFGWWLVTIDFQFKEVFLLFVDHFFSRFDPNGENKCMQIF